MSVLDTPRDVAPEIEVLFREARRRRRRRWTWGTVVSAAALSLIGVLLVSVGGIGGRVGGPGRSALGRPPSVAAHSHAPAQSVPAGTGVVGRGPTAIDFSDPSHGWIASGNLGLGTRNPTIVRTNDGGVNWQRTPVPNLAAQRIDWKTNRAFGALVGIHFATPRRGWFFQAGFGWQTNDAGTTWTTMHFPRGGALVALTSSGNEVWALVESCPNTAGSCVHGGAKGRLYDAISAPKLRWHQVGGVLPAGVGALYARTGDAVVVSLGPFNYRRAVRSGSGGAPSTGCTSVGLLRGGELAGVCGAAGGGNASLSSLAVSKDGGTTWQTLVGGPPSTKYIGSLTTNASDGVFFVTGGQTLWRTSTSQPGWRAVLEAPPGSTDEIYPVHVTGTHGYALVSNGRDVHWFETRDGGLSWEGVAPP